VNSGEWALVVLGLLWIVGGWWVADPAMRIFAGLVVGLFLAFFIVVPRAWVTAGTQRFAQLALGPGGDGLVLIGAYMVVMALVYGLFRCAHGLAAFVGY